MLLLTSVLKLIYHCPLQLNPPFAMIITQQIFEETSVYNDGFDCSEDSISDRVQYDTNHFRVGTTAIYTCLSFDVKSFES